MLFLTSKSGSNDFINSTKMLPLVALFLIKKVVCSKFIKICKLGRKIWLTSIGILLHRVPLKILILLASFLEVANVGSTILRNSLPVIVKVGNICYRIVQVYSVVINGFKFRSIWSFASQDKGNSLQGSLFFLFRYPLKFQLGTATSKS